MNPTDHVIIVLIKSQKGAASRIKVIHFSYRNCGGRERCYINRSSNIRVHIVYDISTYIIYLLYITIIYI
jgi:hypothetical protein